MAIFGLARSGVSALKFLASQKEHQVFAVNQGEPESWERYLEVSKLITDSDCFAEDKALELLGQMDLIIKSPGIPYTHPSLSLARKNKVEIISEIEFAFRYSDIPVIAVTGTNGKTTTATMTAGLLERLGKKVFLCGNIGLPYSEILTSEEAFDWAVVEVSSFQLENIKTFHPRVAVLTNISPSHGERYDSFEVYKNAKLKIFQSMDKEDLALLPVMLSDLNVPCQKKSVRSLDEFDYTQSSLAGPHNKENLYCAYQCALKVIGDKERVDETAQVFINEYKGVSYRIELVQERDKLKIVNDGKSTNMASTLAAVDSFPNERVFLVLGGKLRDREMNFSPLLSRDNVAEVLAFGEAADLIEENLSKRFHVVMFKNLEDLFLSLEKRCLEGVLLFSPAFPSFDLYNNYEERAKDFNRLAQRL